jgi:uncharacterized protein (DUF1778 family)
VAGKTPKKGTTKPTSFLSFRLSPEDALEIRMAALVRRMTLSQYVLLAHRRLVE